VRSAYEFTLITGQTKKSFEFLKCRWSRPIYNRLFLARGRPNRTMALSHPWPQGSPPPIGFAPPDDSSHASRRRTPPAIVLVPQPPVRPQRRIQAWTSSPCVDLLRSAEQLCLPLISSTSGQDRSSPQHPRPPSLPIC
jgi:hypothetical protein